MIDFDSLKLNFREAYRVGKDENGSILKQSEDMLEKEFGDYPNEKLESLWKAVRRYHKTAFYPSIGQILEAMDKGDVKEFSRSNNNDKWYNRCTTCGCNYSFQSRVCPDCNRPLGEDEIFKNEVEIRKGFNYCPNHVTCQDNCSICPSFKKNRNIRGAKCLGWRKDAYQKEGYKCHDCPCKWCCEELEGHDEFHEVGSLFALIKKTSSSFSDPNWRRIYKEKDIKLNDIYNYTGKDYQNITGHTEGRSPAHDFVNWKRYIPSKNCNN